MTENDGEDVDDKLLRLEALCYCPWSAIEGEFTKVVGGIFSEVRQEFALV